MENLENLSLADLRAYAKKLGMKGVSTLRKKELAQRLSQEQQKHTMSEATASIEKQSHDEKKERRQNERHHAETAGSFEESIIRK